MQNWKWFHGIVLVDVWNGHHLQEKLPRLFTYAKNQRISVAAFLANPHIGEQFHLPLSEQAQQELDELQGMIQNIQMRDENKDKWHYIWGSQHYSANGYYNFSYKNFQPPKPFLWIWDSRCSNKLRVFTWLLLMDRLNTRNILKRKNHKIEGNNYNCVLCTSRQEETAMHLFFTCPFAKRCWQLTGIQW